MQRIAGEFNGNSSNTRRGVILHRRDGSANGAGLTACVLGRSILREGGGTREQEDNRDDRSRKPSPGAAPIVTAGKRSVSGLEKQGWDWINIPAHAKTWKTFLSVYSGGAASVGGEPSPCNPRRLDFDLLLRFSHGRQTRSTEFAAAKPSDLQFIIRAPQGRTDELFKTVPMT